jgi:TRAP-type C4-dicarboxylate transport system permease small subunit
MAGLTILMLATCADIFVRVAYFPIKGIFDLVQLITGLSIALTVPQTIISKGNVVVSLVLDLFPERVQDAVESITLLFSVILFGLITAGVLFEASSALRVKEVSETLRIPMFYQKGLIAVPLAVATIVLVVHLMKSFRKAVN